MARLRNRVTNGNVLEKTPTGIQGFDDITLPKGRPTRKSSPRRVQRVFRFSLFVSGATAKSSRAITNIKAICEKHLAGKYKVEVIDIYQQPERLSSDQVVAVPTLVKQYPLPVRKFVGDLSDTHRVVNGLKIEK